MNKHPDNNCPECGKTHLSYDLLQEIDKVNALDVEDKQKCSCGWNRKCQ